MKVFISWSGKRSQVVAELMNEWIKCVLQSSNPWISTRGIDKGSIWFTEISDQLKDTAAGIVCLTQENKDKPWILFETGALAKGLSTNRVCTFLIDLEPKDIEDPLAQFNHTTPDSASMWGLISSLNSCLESNRLTDKILKQVFDTYWPQFDESFKQLLIDNPAKEVVPPRTDKSILSEILNNTRALTGRIRDLEAENESRNKNKNPYSQNRPVLLSEDQLLKSVVEKVSKMKMNGATDIECHMQLVKMGLSHEAVNKVLQQLGIGGVL